MIFNIISKINQKTKFKELWVYLWYMQYNKTYFYFWTTLGLGLN
jgi:hypothetical protein